MNLYYAVTNYHLLCCILHTIKYHSNEENILYLSCWHPDNKFLVNQLRKTNFFTRVEIFNEVVFPSGNKKISTKQLNDDIKKILEEIPINFIEDVNKSTEINIAGDHYCASIYLERNKISYNYLEEACGVLSDEERLMKIVRNIDYSRYQIMKKLGLPGNHIYIKKRYGDLEHQLDGYTNKKDIHFSVANILKNLTNKQIKNIVKVFSNEEFKIPIDSTLLLTFHYVNMDLLTLNQQRYLYSIIVDYFFKGKNLVIKQHPSDVQPDYHNWFPNAVVLPRKMPSELLPVLSEKKFIRALTSYSTSIFTMKSYCGDVVSFGMYIEKSFQLMHKYYFLIQLLEKCKSTDYDVIGVGLDEAIVENIFREYDIKDLKIEFIKDIDHVKSCHKKIIIIDDCNLNESVFEMIVPNNIIFWLREDKILEFFNKYSYCNLCEIFGIFLKKEIIDSSKYFDTQFVIDEIIPYYCCDNEFIIKLNKFKLEKNLENCNINIKLEFNTLKETLEIHRKMISLYNDKIELEENIKKEKEELLKINEDLIFNLNQNNLKINELIEEKKYYRELYEKIVNSSSWKITSIYRKIGGFIKKIVKKGCDY